MATKKRKILILIVSAALVGGGVLVWRLRRQGNQEPTYTTAQVERGTVVATVSASGNLLQTNTFTVTTAVTGVVKSVFVADGQSVEKGQQLVEITPDQDSEEAKIKAWSAYLTAKNSLTSAEQNKLTLEKGVEDAKGELITAQEDFNGDWGSTEYWDAERRKRWSDLKSAETALEIAKQKYSESDDAIAKAQADLDSAWMAYQQTLPTITAPAAGKTSDTSVAPGMLVSDATQKLLTIVGEQKPLLSVSVNEIDIGQIATGQKASVTFDALIDKTFTGKTVGVDRTGTATQGVVTYVVLIQLDSGAEQVYPNMSATAEIILEVKENVLWVPPSAVRTQRGQTVVGVLVDDKTRSKMVEVGLETSDRVEIKSGLNEGEVVIVSEHTGGEQAPAFGGRGDFMRVVH